MKPFLRSIAAFAFAFAFAAGLPAGATQNIETGNYRVDVVMSAGGSLLEGAADVYVLDPQGKVVARRHAVPAVFDLAEGDYTAAVVYKNAQARAGIAPGTDPGTNVLNLDAGEVRLDLVNENGRRARVSGVSWTVSRYRRGSAQGREVVVTEDRRPALTLDAGWYEVQARHAGDAGQPAANAHVIEVKPGRRQAYRIVVD